MSPNGDVKPVRTPLPVVHQARTIAQRTRDFFAGYFWFILKNVIGWTLMLSALPIGIVVPGPGEPVVLQTFLYETLFSAWLAPANASLAYAVTYVLLWLGLLTILYRRRIFIRI